MILARHNQERFAVKVLIRSFESFCHTAHICTSGHFGGHHVASLVLMRPSRSPIQQHASPTSHNILDLFTLHGAYSTNKKFHWNSNYGRHVGERS
jgi:hypothetical protein